MKKIIRLITLGATAAMLALPVAAKSLVSYSDISVQDQCSSENKDAYYAAFLENRKTDQPKAYDNAKKYLACPPGGEVTEATQKIIDYLKKWSTAYDEGSRKSKLPQLLYNEHKYPEAYALGRELLAADPENLKVLIDLGSNGYLVTSLNQPQLNTDALNAAKKALGMLEAGKTVDDWAPLSGKDEAMAYLNYTIGVFTLQTDPSAALKNLIKAAQFETPLKKSPQTYAYIGGSYEEGPYAKLSAEYTTKYKGQNETPESKLALANINQVVDRMVDAYARAVNLAGSDAKLATQKATWTERLTEWYKFRHNQTTDGMNEMVASVLSKPLPPEPTPLTSLPAEPAATPIGNSGTAASTTAATQPATGNKPAAAKTGSPNKPKNK
jgi:hypothetical protein